MWSFALSGQEMRFRSGQGSPPGKEMLAVATLTGQSQSLCYKNPSALQLLLKVAHLLHCGVFETILILKQSFCYF